jgi:hypothetical protein
MAWLSESRSAGQIIVKRYTKTPIWKQGGVLLCVAENTFIIHSAVLRRYHATSI